jgi:hypothetical protein
MFNLVGDLKKRRLSTKSKKILIKHSTLLSPYFDRDFILYTFSSHTAFVVVLTQKNSEGDEFPVDFMSSGLQGAELNYPEVDKHAYVVFKVVKHFRPFLLKSKTKVIVPYPTVRNLLVQKDLVEKRENWITTLQEYDLEIKPVKIVKGQGLCKLVAEFPCVESHEDALYQDSELFEKEVCYIPVGSDPWFYEMKYYLTHGSAPHYLDPKKKRALRLKSAQYH